VTHPENTPPFELAPGDWVVHVGPSTINKVMDFSLFAVHVVEVTSTHFLGYYPHTGKNYIFDRVDFPRWNIATPGMIRLTWENAIQVQKNLRPNNPITPPELKKYGVTLDDR